MQARDPLGSKSHGATESISATSLLPLAPKGPAVMPSQAKAQQSLRRSLIQAKLIHVAVSWAVLTIPMHGPLSLPARQQLTFGCMPNTVMT